jgi:hypothetical protein
MKLRVSRRTETEEDAERPTALEALGMETIAPDGEASARDEVDDILRWREGELAATREKSRDGGADDLRGGGGAEEP